MPPESTTSGDRNLPRKAVTEVAHLVGPGCLKVQNRMPFWQPISGPGVALHPETLRHVLLYGATDVTGAAVRLLWRHEVQVAFLSPHGNRLLGRLQPPSSQRPSLDWLQHQAAASSELCRRQAAGLIREKIRSQLAALRHYQRQGLRLDREVTEQLERAERTADNPALSLDSLRGIEGSSSRAWHGMLAHLLHGWLVYPGRQAHPPTDPVNSLLSLGYMLLLARIQTSLAARGFDPLVGFLHVPRAGRPALACDLIEPFRAPVVDRLVVGLVRQGRFREADFHRSPRGCRLTPAAFRRYLEAFEHRLTVGDQGGWAERIDRRISQLETDIRAYHAEGKR